MQGTVKKDSVTSQHKQRGGAQVKSAETSAAQEQATYRWAGALSGAVPHAVRSFQGVWQPQSSLVRRYRSLVPTVPGRDALGVSLHPRVSPVALGLRAWPSATEHQEFQIRAIEQALQAGVNLVDCGGGLGSGEWSAPGDDDGLTASTLESLLGGTLQGFLSQVGSDVEGPDDLVVISRVGLLTAAETERIPGAREGAPRFFFGDDGLAFCLEPEILEQQVLGSRRRLFGAALQGQAKRAERVHHYVLIDSPERFLVWALERGADPSTAQRWLFERLGVAVRTLGALCRKQSLRGFGISSEAFDLPLGEPCRVNLREVLRLTEAQGCREFFCLVAWPLNWVEAVGLSSAEPSEQPLLDVASSEGLGVLACRPFNAMSRGQLVRLARPRMDARVASWSDERSMKALNNWASLVDDLERMAREVLSEAGAVGGFDEAALEQLVLATLADVRGVSAVLTSMRRSQDVASAFEAMTLPRLLDGRAVLQLLHERIDFVQ